eukprot:SAG31_NODE_989_length_10527_cov_14.905639_6_plen_127_part_00
MAELAGMFEMLAMARMSPTSVVGMQAFLTRMVAASGDQKAVEKPSSNIEALVMARHGRSSSSVAGSSGASVVIIATVRRDALEYEAHDQRDSCAVVSFAATQLIDDQVCLYPVRPYRQYATTSNSR